jgi:two-component system chemotaxis sensor kinase CheA
MTALSPDKMLALFAQEAEVRLAQLGQLLLQLEQTGADDGLIRSIYREFHTLKGSAAVTGLVEVSRAAHDLEELVDELRSGQRTPTPDVIDTLLTGADRLGELIAGSFGAKPEDAGSHAGPPAIPRQPAARDAPSSAGSPEQPSTAAASGDERGPAPAPAPPITPPGGTIQVPTERLEELLRLVGESASAHLRVGRMLKDQFSVDPTTCSEFTELSRCLNALQDRAMRTQMVPVATITDQLHRAVRALSRAQGKDVRWDVRGTDTELDRGVLHQLSGALLHLVRNAVDHGIEPAAEREAAGKPPHGTLRLHAMQLGSEVIVAVTDDGGGIDTERVSRQAARRGIDTEGLSREELLDLTFHPGLSTAEFVTDVSGRGVGLDVVRANVEAAHGRVELRSEPGSGAEFRIVVPITMAVLRCLLVEAGGQRFALPFHRVLLSQNSDLANLTSAQGRPVVWSNGQAVPIRTLAETLGLSDGEPCVGPIVVLADTSRRHAFQVDRLVGQRDVVLKGLSTLLPRLPTLAGASIEPDGSVLLVLDPPGLIQRARSARRPAEASARRTPSALPPQRILVVDDALTVRELQRSILERAGFEVQVATDGISALTALGEQTADLILTDVEMPNMDGFALTEAVRGHPNLATIPVLILTSRASDADRQRGLDVGANGYIVKSGFDESSLLAAVHRLLGEPE